MKTLTIGDMIVMPSPENDDAWQFAGFVATVQSIGDELVIVEDADGDCFSIEIERAERNVIDENDL